MNAPVDVTRQPGQARRARSTIPMKGNGTDDVSSRAVAALRDGIVDETVGTAPGVEHAYVVRHGRRSPRTGTTS